MFDYMDFIKGIFVDSNLPQFSVKNTDNLS